MYLAWIRLFPETYYTAGAWLNWRTLAAYQYGTIGRTTKRNWEVISEHDQCIVSGHTRAIRVFDVQIRVQATCDIPLSNYKTLIKFRVQRRKEK